MSLTTGQQLTAMVGCAGFSNQGGPGLNDGGGTATANYHGTGGNSGGPGVTNYLAGLGGGGGGASMLCLGSTCTSGSNLAAACNSTASNSPCVLAIAGGGGGGGGSLHQRLGRDHHRLYRVGDQR